MGNAAESKEIVMDPKIVNGKNIAKFVIFSLIGIFVFFVQFQFNGRNTIFVDHVIQNIKGYWPIVSIAATYIFMVGGAVEPFIKKTWKKNTVTLIFTILKVFGAICGTMFIFKFGPKLLMADDMIPYVYQTVCGAVALVVPIGSLFLSFLMNYGLLEFVGVLMRPIMRKVWKVPGSAAINAVTSFIGSFAVGIMFTDRMYKEGKYNLRESTVIVTGFATVSASFVVIVANFHNMMNYWNLVFWGSMFVTFAVTAITAHIYPLNKVSDRYWNDDPHPLPEYHDHLLKRAYLEGLTAANNADSLPKTVVKNFLDGCMMSFRFIPVVMALGLIGTLLATYTPIFDWLGWIYWPFARIFGIPESVQVGKAVSLAFVDMFTSDIILAKATAGAAGLAAKYVVGVTSIAISLGLASTIPCMLATDIEVSMKDIFILAVERAILCMLLSGVIALIAFGV
ncbi:MAG: YjiH family protein [Lachnospiraceae bacterium]|nr:YjiH family protein [Lachnospiraceae bacterium]